MIKLTTYYKNFVSLRGTLAIILGVIPVTSFLTSDWGIYIFPPLGKHETLWKLLAVIMVILVTVIVYMMQDKPIVLDKAKRLYVALGTLGISLLLGITLGVLYGLYVHNIYVQTNKETVLVSVGYERTEFGNGEKFRNLSDRQILVDNGVHERVVEKFWTQSSTVTVRVALYVIYILILILLSALSSFLVLYNLIDNPETGESSTVEE